MKATDSDYLSTVSIGSFSMEALKNMHTYMENQIKKITQEKLLVEAELKRRGIQ